MKSYQIEYKKLQEPVWFPFLLYLYAIVTPIYLIWRSTLTNWDIWYGPVLYFAEIYGIITTGLFLLISQKVYTPVHRPVTKLCTVDVMIPTYNEPIAVLQPVVEAAKDIRGVRNVLVLDDGNRKEVKSMAKRLGVKYHPRTTNEHAKAGNLNNGLRFTNAEFLVMLDADHIPLPDFIEQTLGFFDDPKLAIVQSPQTFYNTDSFLFRRRKGKPDGWSEQVMFYDCIQPAKNRWNSAFFVGTSAMLRSTAIIDVKGFATGTATEDIHTSLRLHARGWKSVFLPRPLAYGLEASSFKEFYKQRKRWAAGSLGLLFRSSDSPLRAKGLTFMQRANYLSACLAHLQGVQKMCFFILPIVTMAWGVSPITGNLGLYSYFFLAFLAVSIGATWAYSRGTYHMLYSETYALANMLAHFGGIKGVIKVQKKFAVSLKRTQRKEHTWSTTFLWVMLWVAVAALLRTAWIYIVDNKEYGLFVYSFIFTFINVIVLLSFLLHLRNYENKDEQKAMTEQIQRLQSSNALS